MQQHPQQYNNLVAQPASALQVQPLESFHQELEDVVFVNDVSVPYSLESFSEQASATLAKLELILRGHGLTRHNLINVKTTLANLGESLIEFNALWDGWMSGVEVLPSQTAAQVDVRAGQPQLVLSVVASGAVKKTLPDGLTRSGGGEPMGPLRMHYPWSKVVEAGNIVWLAGILDPSLLAENGEKQLAGILGTIDGLLEQIDMSQEEIEHTHVLVPLSLPYEEKVAIEAMCVEYGGHVVLEPVARTCLDCKVEVTCVARRSRSIASSM